MEDTAENSASEDRERHDGERRLPYEAPAIESGVAFERVLLLSGSIEGIFCENPV